MACVEDNGLAAFVDGRASADQARNIREHLGLCQRCREVVLEMAVPAVDAITRRLARRHGLTGEERDELRSQLWYKLVETRLLHSFEGRSRLSTFLCTSLTRLFVDWKRARDGRWRPSVAARRLGPAAEALERLLVWKRMPLRAALAEITRRFPDLEDAELERILASIRTEPRPLEVGADALESLAQGPTPEQCLDQQRSAELARVVVLRLKEELDQLPAEDRVLLKLRFLSSMPIAEIARRLGRDQRELYRRFERLLRDLRARLEGAGVTGRDVETAVADPSADLDLALTAIADATEGEDDD